MEFWYRFSLRWLVEFPSETVWAWCFLFWKITYYRLHFFNRSRTLRIFSFFLCGFLKNRSISSRLSKCGHRMSLLFWCPWDLQQWPLFYIQHWSLVSSLSLFLFALAKGLLMLLIVFKESLLDFVSFPYCFPVFNFIDFCSNFNYLLLALEKFVLFFFSKMEKQVIDFISSF